MIYIDIFTKKKAGYNWYVNKEFYARGYGFYNEIFYEDSELLELFSRNDFDINKLRGCFSLIKNVNDILIAYTDRFNIFPIYYYQSGNNIYLSDDVSSIIKKSENYSVNKDARVDWIYGGFVTNNETLINGINNIPFSSILEYKDNMLSINEYTNFTLLETEYFTDEDFKNGFEVAIDKTIKKMRTVLKNKRVILFLSGGADSKLCAYLLYKMQHSNVICVTYGRKDNNEMKNAIDIADKYNFEHIKLPYKRKEWKNLFKDKRFLDYMNTTGSFKNTPHTMDFFALKYLEKNNYIDKDTIFIQGQLGSVAFARKLGASKENIIKSITKVFFYYYNPKKLAYKMMEPRLLKNINRFKYKEDTIRDYIGIYNGLAYDTNRSFHMLKSINAISYFNGKFFMPIINEDIVDFYRKCDEKILYERIYYKEYIKKETGIDNFEEEDKLYNKVHKTIKDVRKSCVKLSNVLTNNYEDIKVPNILNRIYRNYRNFLTYISFESYKINLKKLEKLKNDN